MQRVEPLFGASSPFSALAMRMPGSWVRPRVDGLALPFAPICRGSAEIGRELYRGKFRFAGLDLDAGERMPFARPEMPLVWQRELYGFGWLRHVAAEKLVLHRVFARALFSAWADSSRHHPAIASHPAVRARRVVSFIHFGGWLLEGASANFAAIYYQALVREICTLLAHPGPRESHLEIAIACASGVVALNGFEGGSARALARLSSQLDEGVLPDGGHVSRNPERLLSILLDLVPLRMALTKARQDVPRSIHAALERMVPMLRFFVHGDGGLAAFQGATGPAAAAIRAILETDTAQGKPLAHAPHSDYCRLAHGNSIVILDAGTPAHCLGPLGFELSDGPHRIVINCGRRHEHGDSASAADHSTGTLDVPHQFACASSSFAKLLHARSQPQSGAEIRTSGDGSLVRSWHDGYALHHGVIHERDVYLSSSGLDLRGEDRFRPIQAGTVAAGSFAIRFHLHPAIKATVSKDGASILLLLPNRTGWRLTARGASLNLEEDVYEFGHVEPRQSHQIVLRGELAHPDRVNWAFKRIEKKPAAHGSGADQLSF